MTLFSIRRAIITGYIAALAIISFFAVYTYSNMQKGEEDHALLNQTLGSLKVIENVFDDVQHIESGQRGYIISGDKVFLGTYYKGLSNIKRDSLALLRIMLSNENRKEDIRQLVNLIRQKIEFASATIQIRLERGEQAAEEKVKSEEGRRLMENIYSIIHKIEEEERIVLNKYSDHRGKAARQTTLLFFILAMSFFIFLLSFFLFVRRDVKQRLNAELATQVNKKTDAFKDILNRISDGFIAFDKEWRLVYINGRAAEILGKKPGEIVERSAWELYPHAVGNEFYKAYQEAMQKQEYVFLEAYHPGFKIWLENHIYPSPEGVSIHFKDITEKKKTEIKLKQTTEKLDLVAKATNDILWEANLVDQKMWWSDNFFEKFGYNREKVAQIDKSWESYLHPGDKERILKEVTAVIEDTNQTTWIDEYRFAKANGNYVNIYDRCYIQRDTDGKAYRMIGSMTDLTPLFETKAELLRTEERYKNLVDAIDGIVWEADPHTFQFSFVSRQAERLLGYPVDEWTSAAGFWADHIHPDDKNWAVNYCVQSTQKMQPHEFEYRMIAKDGRIVWLRDIVSVEVENGKTVLLRGLMVDITRNKEAEQAIKESEEKYRILVEQATDGIFIADQTGHFIIVNSSGCKMSQYSEEELKKMTIYHLADPEDLKTNPFYFNEMKGEKGARAERRMRKKDGSVIDIEINAKFLSDGRFLAFIRDITDTKKALEELKASEENRRMIMDSALDAIVCIDTSGIITIWSTQAAHIFGWKKEEMIGKRLSETIIPRRYRAMHEAGMKKYLQTGEGPVLNKTIEIKALNNKGEEFPVELSIVPVKQGATEFFCASLRDITQRKKAEEKLRRSNERFELIARTTHDAIWEWNLETGELWANEVHQQLYGRTKTQPVPTIDEWKQRIHPEDRDEIINIQDKALLSGKSYWESEYRFQKLDGDYIILFDRTYIVRNGEGKPIHLTGSMIDITGRKKADEKLRKSNERFELIARTTNEAIWEWDFETSTAWGNDTHQELYGLTSADAIPDQEEWKKRIHPDDRNAIINDFERAFASRENIWIAEYRFLTDKAGIKNIYDRTYILRNERGKPIRMTGSMMDVTERKKAEQEITKAKELADRMIDSLPGVFYFYDKTGKFIRWNTQFETVTGYSPEEIAGMHPSDFFEGEDKEYIIKRIQGVFEKGMNDAETNFTTRTGEKIPYYFKAVLINYEGEPCLLGSGIDISERKKAEEELRVSEKNYRSLVEQAADAIFIFNEKGFFEDVNSISSDLLGYSKDELLSMQLTDILFKEDLVDNPVLFSSLDRGESVIKRRNFRQKNGEPVAVEIHSKKLVDGRYLSMVRDLTERIATEKKLEESFDAIRRLTEHIQNIREEERAHIAREIHDELGQHLTVLKMDVSWLTKKIGIENKPAHEKLKSLSEMLDGTIKTVRRISSELRPSLLDDLGLVAAIDWHLKEFGKRSGLKITFLEPEKETDLAGSIKTGLFRIFQESLTNIARHSEAKNVTVSLQYKEDYTILSIKDDGIGFEGENKGNKKTLGILGMKERTAMMGGIYETHSKQGQGTNVIVSVPLK